MMNRRLRAESKVTLLLVGFIAIAAACPIASKAQATATQAQTPTASKAQTPTASPAQTSAASKVQTTITASPQTGVTPLQLNPCLAQCVSLKQQVPQMTQQFMSLKVQLKGSEQAYKNCLLYGSDYPPSPDRPQPGCDPQAELAALNSLKQQVQGIQAQLTFLQQVLTFLACPP